MIANGFHRLTEGFELLQRLAVVEERLSGIRAQHRRALAEVSEAHSTQIQAAEWLRTTAPTFVTVQPDAAELQTAFGNGLLEGATS
jgi:hypothetical protein